MFAEKVCEQVVGFSAMAEDEMFDVNGGTAYDSNGNAIPGTGNNGTSTSGSKPENSGTSNNISSVIKSAVNTVGKWVESGGKALTIDSPIAGALYPPIAPVTGVTGAVGPFIEKIGQAMQK